MYRIEENDPSEGAPPRRSYWRVVSAVTGVGALLLLVLTQWLPHVAVPGPSAPGLAPVPNAVIAGRVLWAGTPVSGIFISLRARPDGANQFFPVATTRSERDGIYSFSVPPGSYELCVNNQKEDDTYLFPGCSGGYLVVSGDRVTEDQNLMRPMRILRPGQYIVASPVDLAWEPLPVPAVGYEVGILNPAGTVDLYRTTSSMLTLAVPPGVYRYVVRALTTENGRSVYVGEAVGAFSVGG